MTNNSKYVGTYFFKKLFSIFSKVTLQFLFIHLINTHRIFAVLDNILCSQESVGSSY